MTAALSLSQRAEVTLYTARITDMSIRNVISRFVWPHAYISSVKGQHAGLADCKLTGPFSCPE